MIYKLLSTITQPYHNITRQLVLCAMAMWYVRTVKPLLMLASWTLPLQNNFKVQNKQFQTPSTSSIFSSSGVIHYNTLRAAKEQPDVTSYIPCILSQLVYLISHVNPAMTSYRNRANDGKVRLATFLHPRFRFCCAPADVSRHFSLRLALHSN